MSYYTDLKTGHDIASFVRRQVKSAEEIATTVDGSPIQVVKLGGGRKPAILLKAGNHSSEIAGIHALLTFLAEGLQSPFETHIIPCGSPFDFGGYRFALEWASETKVHIEDDEQCLAELTRLGRKVYEGEHFILFEVRNTLFTWVDRKKLDSRRLFYGQLDTLTLRDPELRAILSGKRIFFPNELYYPEDYGSYDQAGLVGWTSPDGYVSNLNRLYDRYDVPPELWSIRDYCERLKPAMVIDLHESCINTRIPEKLKRSGEQLGNHFLILPPVHAPSYEAIETPVAEAMVAATGNAGFDCFTLSQLEAAWGYPDTDYFHGYLRKDVRDGMPFYRWAIRFADVSITTETSMDMPIEKRVMIHITLVNAAIEAFSRFL
ncbi:MAG: hypothetical protein JSV89_12945 [Spirochaetaceae bacterium]|nr:MAG: hypothetical protein JSV89_12945 [Spirochaetaceae bacterium]